MVKMFGEPPTILVHHRRNDFARNAATDIAKHAMNGG
jgi:hypothetical protein